MDIIIGNKIKYRKILIVILIIQTGDQARSSFVNSGSAIRVCRWSPDGTKLATAGDDEKTTIWDANTLEELQ